MALRSSGPERGRLAHLRRVVALVLCSAFLVGVFPAAAEAGDGAFADGGSGPGSGGSTGGGGGRSNWPCDAGETRAQRYLRDMYAGSSAEHVRLGDVLGAVAKYDHKNMTPEQKAVFADAMANAYYWTCNGFQTGTIVVPGLLPTAAEVIAVLPWQVWSTIDPPEPTIDRNPAPNVATVVRVPVYVWTTNLDSIVGTDSAPSFQGQVVVTVTATPTLIVGSAPNSSGFSAASCPPYTGAATPCAIDFTRSGDDVTATVVVTWTGVSQITVGGVPQAPVLLGTLTRTSTFVLDVDEVQAVNQN